MQDKYPVIVEYTHRHVVWVEADDQTEAVAYWQDEPYRVTDDAETLFDASYSVGAPDEWDWDSVYDGGHSYAGRYFDAHVQEYHSEMYRRMGAEVDREDAAEDAGTLPLGDRRTCRPCRCWTSPEHVASPRHAAGVAWAASQAEIAARRLTEVGRKVLEANHG